MMREMRRRPCASPSRMCISGVREAWISWPIRPSRTGRLEEFCVTACLHQALALRVAPLPMSDVEEDGFTVTLEADVEDVHDRAVAILAPRDQRVAPHRRLDHVQDRILRVGRRFVREVQA